MSKHAYMIMAHHRSDLLQYLLDALDDERNVIIVHIDKKSRMQDKDFFCKKSKLVFLEPMNVNWGGFSQVKCTLELMKKALSLGPFSYYHFLTGSNYPLRNQNYIHSFFEENTGYEFIGFDQLNSFESRVMYYIPFAEAGKLRGVKGRLIHYSRVFFLCLQKVFLVNRLKSQKLIIKKGCAYYSLTEDLLELIVQNEKNITKLLKYTLCGDEIFVQTIAYNSSFRNKIYNDKNEWQGCMRDLAWPSNIVGNRVGMNYSMKDLDFLLHSDKLFAMKFESPDGIQVIQHIKEARDI